uniref:Uncharacterized protein n=1 Tax=Panagrolaimus davidi TaxID=227884 RepID=A0A914QF72_9BILA
MSDLRFRGRCPACPACNCVNPDATVDAAPVLENAIATAGFAIICKIFYHIFVFVNQRYPSLIPPIFSNKTPTYKDASSQTDTMEK